MSQKKDWKDWKDQWIGDRGQGIRQKCFSLDMAQVLDTQTHCSCGCLHKTCTVSSQLQILGDRRDFYTTSLSKELLAIDVYLEKESLFFEGWPLGH